MFDKETLAAAEKEASGFWWRRGHIHVAEMLLAGWRPGEKYHTECRPSRWGVGGEYWIVWPGGELPQAGRSVPADVADLAMVLADLTRERVAAAKAAKAAAEAAEAAKAATEAKAAERAELARRIEVLRTKTGRDARFDLAVAQQRLAALAD